MKRRPKSEGRRPKKGRNPKAKAMVGVSYMESGMDGRGVLLNDGESGSKTFASDLGERSARFAEAVIRFAKKIPSSPVNNRLVDQLVGAATSTGANYYEADDSISTKEFKQKVGYSRKESKEVMHFLRMVAAAEEGMAAEARSLWREAKELNLIFGAIWGKV